MQELEKKALADRIGEKNDLLETLRHQYDQLFLEKTALTTENKTLFQEQSHAEGRLQQMVQLQTEITAGKKLTTELQEVLSRERSVNAALETRLEQEIAIISDRVDITEEIVRMKSHLDLFNKTLNTNGEVGKRLNFILQEMNREANTMNSKTTMLEISHRVIKIKEEVEKLREQIQNIE